jgi:hypothetical protein
MDTLPDFELPITPEGYEYMGMDTPKVGDYMVDYYGKPYLVDEERIKYLFDKHPIYRKMGG